MGFAAYDNVDALQTPGNLIDGVYLQSLDGTVDIDFVTEKAGTQVDNSAVATHADATMVKLAFMIDMGPVAGQGRVVALVNDIVVKDYYSEVLPTEIIGPFMYFTSGSANTQAVNIDYIFCGGSDGR